MAELTILLVEDEVSTCKRFIDYIERKEDIVLVNATNSASQAISDIDTYRPNAIILNMELHYGSGFEVLSGVNKMSEKPYVVITTNNFNETTNEYTRINGADFIMYKQQKDYSEEGIVDLLYSMRNVIKGKSLQKKHVETENQEYRNKRILSYTNEELNRVGVNPKVVGFQYLVESINMIVNENVSNVCSHVAKKYKKSEESVRRAMQTAINRAWTKMDTDTLLENYTARITSENGCPTIIEFIYYYANKIKSKM